MTAKKSPVPMGAMAIWSSMILDTIAVGLHYMQENNSSLLNFGSAPLRQSEPGRTIWMPQVGWSATDILCSA